MNIGITISVKKKDNNIWINGINQNAIFLYKTLQNINKHKVVLLNPYDDIPNGNNLGWNVKKYETVHLNSVLNDLDLIIVLGGALSKVEEYRLLGKKIIYYNCGNEYVMSMENVLFKPNEQNKKKSYPYFDEIWMIPQLIKQNQYYLETLNRTKVREIPFVWASDFLDSYNTHMNGKAQYFVHEGAKKISIFEPNINTLKYCMYPLMIIENIYRQYPELIQHIYVTNTKQINHKTEFISIVSHLDIIKKHKTSFEARYAMPFFLGKHTDIVVSHQWDNPLNYAYLDAVYLGYPLVHNAYLCKDLGYYYEGWQGKEGEKQLKLALTEHDQNLEEYQFKNKHYLSRFSTDNGQNIETYDWLIQKLFK
jgi:hypothetical protein